MKSSKVILGNSCLSALVAETEMEKSKGLMHQPWPPPVMAFPFSISANRSFWMKNTISPLDLVFCNQGKVVGICKGEPLSTRMISPGRPSDLVIELPAGTADQLGVKAGDTAFLSS